jgi:hypothetical protein
MVVASGVCGSDGEAIEVDAGAGEENLAASVPASSSSVPFSVV